MPFDDYYAFRRTLVDFLARDVVGPSSPTEILDDLPLDRYASGILYPTESGALDAGEDIDSESAEGDDETGAADPPVALANVRYPSSVGLSFAVDSHVAPRIVVTVRAARYEQLPGEDPNLLKKSDQVEGETPAPPEHEDRAEGETGKSLKEAKQADGVRRSRGPGRWKRLSVDPAPVLLDVSKPEPALRIDLTEGLQIFCRIRAVDENGAVPVTIVLLNTKKSAVGEGLRDADSFFQCEIQVTAPEASQGAFVERPSNVFVGSDEDIRSYRLLYRNALEFAVGHGCSVRWDYPSECCSRAASISTTFIPEYALPLADSNPDIRVASLEMVRLAQDPRDQILNDLRTLCDGYEGWIALRAAEVKSLPVALRDVADGHLTSCREASSRIRKGITLLGRDDVAWRAFRLANRAMLQQRARTVRLRNGRPAGGPTEGPDHKWRPFQLAFILLCLEGIADPKSQDRRIADLLWFPTGGGKTEAYLGLVAFTVFLRRLRNKDGGGVTALMRYTLRLLTIQQFERASLLICSCEAVRQSERDLGSEPISIGLWVGQGATPNSRADASAALQQLRTGLPLDSGNPVQLHSCPWCGTPLDHSNYYVATDRKRLVVACKQPDCLFKTGLPLYVVDEDIYDYRPTLIVATVDKFASLPWRESSADLFNLKNAGRPTQLPPELIIQDELHLISGPLGTLVGLYETAVDLLCTRDDVGPKIVASTATIRRAADQAHGLFNRPMHQFPPAGLDARDSYFAVEAPPSEKGTRMYVGLMAPGKSHTTLLIRAYAALLQGAADLPALDKIKDPYWTLVGYFNSLRVLGGARMQVQDDVGDRMELLATLNAGKRREIDERIELTSREPSGNIPDHLKHMAVELPDQRTLDVILATNMISVGVDIDRLGLMAVMGQPQSTSEYIQSTSRVGRQYPGLVVVLFNSARSRDRSHYESFLSYHSALYRQVESTSVTPFSVRARDRGLHAVFVALARLMIPELRPNKAAADVDSHIARLDEIKKLIVSRVRSVSPEDAATTATQLDQILTDWRDRVTEFPSLVYQDWRDASKALLVTASPETVGEEEFSTLWSLRDVDKESNLYLVQ